MYTDESLMSELHRFVNQYGHVPTASTMDATKGYPSSHAYLSHFCTWNNALLNAGYNINRRYLPIDGHKKCVKCGDLDTSKWHHDLQGDLICHACYGQLRSLYTYGKLNPDSNVGIGVIAEKLVSKLLGISPENQCNIEYKFNHAYDLYSDVLGTINVKSSTFRSNRWSFNLRNACYPDTYVFVAFSDDRKNIDHLWIIPSNNSIVKNKIGLSIQNSEKARSRVAMFEQDPLRCNRIYNSMSLENCPFMGHGAKIAGMKITGNGVEVQA